MNTLCVSAQQRALQLCGHAPAAAVQTAREILMFVLPCTHHDNCNHQSDDTNQVNLICKQVLNPIVAILQRKTIKTLESVSA